MTTVIDNQTYQDIQFCSPANLHLIATHQVSNIVLLPNEDQIEVWLLASPDALAELARYITDHEPWIDLSKAILRQA